MIKFLQFCLISAVTAQANKSAKSLLSLNKTNVVITKILSHFTDYSIIIHLDNTTSQEAFAFEDELFSSLQGTLVQNYDRKVVFNRPVGYKFIHVVFLKNLFRFEEFSKTMFSFEYSDVILILSRHKISTNITAENVKILPFWQQKGLDSAGSVFVLDLTNNDLYHECYYCGSITNVLIKISTGEAIGSDVLGYLNNFTNFRGHHFRIGYMPFLPFFWCEESFAGCRVAGSEGQLLKVLSTTLNFRYSVESFEDYVGGQWRALVDAVHYKRLDWAVGGISSSPERGRLTDLTRSIHTEPFTVLYHSSATNSNWKSWKRVFLPFELSLWLCVFLVLIFISILLKNIPDYLRDNSSTNTFAFFEVAMRGLVEQPLIVIPVKSMSKRLLLISWWYVAIIIATAYRSKLASFLIHPTNIQPRSILELLRDGYRFQVNNEDWTVLKKSLESSVEIEHAYTDILKRANDNLNICSSVQHSMDRKVAVIDEATTLQYEVIANCRPFLSVEDFSQLRVIEEQVFPSFHVWPLQLGAPYRHRFSAFIENLHSSGILRRWYNLASEKQLPVSNHYNERKTAVPLTISTMTAPAIILSVGLVFALLVFVCEVLYFTLNNLISFYKKHSIA